MSLVIVSWLRSLEMEESPVILVAECQPRCLDMETKSLLTIAYRRTRGPESWLEREQMRWGDQAQQLTVLPVKLAALLNRLRSHCLHCYRQLRLRQGWEWRDVEISHAHQDCYASYELLGIYCVTSSR